MGDFVDHIVNEQVVSFFDPDFDAVRLSERLGSLLPPAEFDEEFSDVLRLAILEVGSPKFARVMEALVMNREGIQNDQIIDASAGSELPNLFDSGEDSTILLRPSGRIGKHYIEENYGVGYSGDTPAQIRFVNDLAKFGKFMKEQGYPQIVYIDFLQDGEAIRVKNPMFDIKFLPETPEAKSALEDLSAGLKEDEFLKLGGVYLSARFPFEEVALN